MATLLVTGGAGYVGSHTCKALAAAGHRPVVYDNLSRGHRRAVKWGPLEEGELTDPARLDAVFARHAPAAVLHFAALSCVGESVAQPGLYYRTNVWGSLCLLEAMRRHRVAALVFSSSCATYGLPERLPIPEDHPQRPISPYGETKLVVEHMLRDFGSAYGLRALALRYFNAAGADAAGELGEDHHPETHAIPLAILAALGRRPQFEIFGTDYPTPDGTAIRDYIHVADLAAAHVAAVGRLLAGAPSAACNLGTGVGTSVLDLVRAVERAGGRPVPVLRQPRRPGDPAELVAAAGSGLAGWQPRHRDIGGIVASAFAWHAAAVPADDPGRPARNTEMRGWP